MICAPFSAARLFPNRRAPEDRPQQRPNVTGGKRPTRERAARMERAAPLTGVPAAGQGRGIRFGSTGRRRGTGMKKRNDVESLTRSRLTSKAASINKPTETAPVLRRVYLSSISTGGVWVLYSVHGAS